MPPRLPGMRMPGVEDRDRQGRTTELSLKIGLGAAALQIGWGGLYDATAIEIAMSAAAMALTAFTAGTLVGHLTEPPG